MFISTKSQLDENDDHSNMYNIFVRVSGGSLNYILPFIMYKTFVIQKVTNNFPQIFSGKFKVGTSCHSTIFKSSLFFHSIFIGETVLIFF